MFFSSRTAVAIELSLPGPVFNISEGLSIRVFVQAEGFAYGSIPLTVSLLTYSEYMDLGFIVGDNFDSYPIDAASAGSYVEYVVYINKTKQCH